MYQSICKCRICGNENLRTIVDLGMQKLTGVFPAPGEEVGEGPLELVKCVPSDDSNDVCGLVQLKHSCDCDEMYGENYGYRSGLNQSMVAHLTSITADLKKQYSIQSGDYILDIGSNDSTLLRSYGELEDVHFVGMDPTGTKFKKYYPEYVTLIEDFFSATYWKNLFGDKKAKIITSIACFYDLESPIDFAKDICEILADDGVWVLEQSYMPFMLETRSYDTICQEHLEFYCLKQIEWIMTAAGLKVIDVDCNDVNGGSFKVVVAKADASYSETENVKNMREYEVEHAYDDLQVYEKFVQDIDNAKKELLDFLKSAHDEGKRVYGYGASTKGNVLLQYCNVTKDELIAIAEVNEDKFGHVTPGTNIPIVSEQFARENKPDYFLVLPWHFKDNILQKEQKYMEDSGCKFVFPLPRFEVVDYKDLQ